MEDGKYIVYIRIDNNGSIIEINSDAFLDNTEGYIELDSGYGDKYHHAQNNYFSKPLYDERWYANYKMENGEVLERTEEEKEIELSNRPEPLPTNDERLAALEEAMLAMLSRSVTNV